MMQQYDAVKKQMPQGTLLLFRLGDFYELFFEDAVTAARVLNITLTKWQGHPMAGIPFHALDAYVARLREAGHVVAICDKVAPPRQSPARPPAGNSPAMGANPLPSTGPVADPVTLAKQCGGRLVKHPGGFWGAVDWNPLRPYARNDAVRTMVRAGHAYVSARHTDRFRRTQPTEIRLKPAQGDGQTGVDPKRHEPD